MNDRRVPGLMRRVLPHASTVKFLVILRDPVDRAVSGYWQADPKRMTIETAIELALAEVDILNKVYSSTLGLQDVEVKAGRVENDEACISGREQYQRLNTQLVDTLHVKHPWFLRYIRGSFNSSLEDTEGRIIPHEARAS